MGYEWMSYELRVMGYEAWVSIKREGVPKKSAHPLLSYNFCFIKKPFLIELIRQEFQLESRQESRQEQSEKHQNPEHSKDWSKFLAVLHLGTQTE